MCSSTCDHVTEAAFKMKSSIHDFMFLAIHVGLFLSRKNEQHGLALRHRQECICPLVIRLVLRGSIFRLGVHSTENKGEIEKYSWDKGPPSNNISASLLFTSEAVLNQARGY